MADVSPDGLFEIQYERKDRDSYFESDTTESWYVVRRGTREIVTTFCGGTYAAAAGSSESGVERVAFSEDGLAVVATSYDGKVERVALPGALGRSRLGKALGEGTGARAATR